MSSTKLPYISIELDQPGDKGDFRIKVTDNQTRRTIVQNRLKEKRSSFEYVYTSRLIEHVQVKVIPDEEDNELAMARFDDLVRYGQQLYRELFSTKSDFKSYVETADHFQDGAHLVLRFRDTASELWNIPWEFLHDGQQFLALNAAFPVWRNLVDAKLQNDDFDIKEIPTPLRMLIVISQPRNAPPLNIDSEMVMLREAVQSVSNSGNIEIDIIEHGSLENLADALQRKPYHVIHYSGHGSIAPQGSCLIMEDQHGMGRPVFLTELLPVLSESNSLRFVFLSACKTGNISDTEATSGIATGLLRVVPSVLAMQFSIRDDSAGQFARAFYGAIGEGRTLEEAMYHGRRALYNYRPLMGDWGVPTLYTHKPHMRLLKRTVSLNRQKTTSELAPASASSELSFIGRRDDLRTIREIFVDPAVAMLFVWGMAGTGKTTLVEQAIERPGHDVVIDDRLILHCDKLKPQVLVKLLAEWIIQHAPKSRNALAHLLKDPKNALAVAAKHMQGKHLVLVLDRVDVLMSPEQSRQAEFVDPTLHALFEALASTEWPVLTICTGRFRWQYIAQGDNHYLRELHLRNLAASDVTFILQSFKHLHTAGSDAVQAFYQQIGGHPQTIHYINHQLGKTQRFDLLEHSDFPKMLAKYWHKAFLRDLFSLLKPGELDALRLLSVHNDIFNPHHVQTLMEFETLEEAEQIIVGWETLSLANFIGNDEDTVWYIVPNLVITYVTAQLTQEKKQPLHNRIASIIEDNFFTSAEERFEATGGPEPHAYEKLDSTIDHLDWIFEHSAPGIAGRYASLAVTWQQHYREAERHTEANNVAVALLPLLHRFNANDLFNRLLNDVLEQNQTQNEAFFRGQFWRAVRMMSEGKPDKAMKLLQKLADHFAGTSDSGFHGLYVDCLEKQGEIYRNLGQDDQAMAKWRKVLELRQASGGRIEIARVALSIAEIAYHAGAIPPAKEHVDAGLKFLSHSEQSETGLRILGNLLLYKGHLKRNEGDDFEAIIHYSMVYRIGQDTGNPAVMGISLESLGYTYYLLNQHELAARLLLQAMDIYEKIKDMRSLSVVLTRLAMVHQARDNKTEAMAMGERARDLSLEHAPENAAQTIELLNSLTKKKRRLF